MPLEAVTGIGILILGLIAFGFYRDYKKETPENKKRLIVVMYAVIAISILLTIGIQYAHLPERLFPQYYQWAEWRYQQPFDWVYPQPH